MEAIIATYKVVSTIYDVIVVIYTIVKVAVIVTVFITKTALTIACVAIGIPLFLICFLLYIAVKACFHSKKKADYYEANMGEGKSRIYKELKEKAKQAKKIAGKALRYPLKSKADIEESNEGDEAAAMKSSRKGQRRRFVAHSKLPKSLKLYPMKTKSECLI